MYRVSFTGFMDNNNTNNKNNNNLSFMQFSLCEGDVTTFDSDSFHPTGKVYIDHITSVMSLQPTTTSEYESGITHVFRFISQS